MSAVPASYYDELETRAPDERENALMAALPGLVAHARAHRSRRLAQKSAPSRRGFSIAGSERSAARIASPGGSGASIAGHALRHAGAADLPEIALNKRPRSWHHSGSSQPCPLDVEAPAHG